MRKCIIILLAAFLLCLGAPNANAWFFGIFDAPEPAGDIGFDSASDCGKQIRIFRKFMHDGKICKQDDDCISMTGMCPLGCIFYINKNFEEIIITEMGKVDDICTSSVCAYKCAKPKGQIGCVQNKCQLKAKKK